MNVVSFSLFNYLYSIQYVSCCLFKVIFAVNYAFYCFFHHNQIFKLEAFAWSRKMKGGI